MYDRLMSHVMHPLVDSSVQVGSFDLSSPEFWLAPRDYREGAFQALRQLDHLTFSKEWEFEDSPFPPGDGYWNLVRHEDVWFVSRNPSLFISGKGSNIADLPTEMSEFFGSMIAMDDPKHFRLRSIVSKGFTPKEINRVEGYVKTKAEALVDKMLEKFPDGECDFVSELAAPLPLQIICEMMGIPEEDEAQIFVWTNTILGAGDPEFGGTLEALMAAAIGMFSYAQSLGESRLATPTDDLTSVMMHAEVDGERLTTQEFGSFFILLAVAGNETTRNAISHGMRALTMYPDQKKIWFDDFETHTKTAVDEIVRWATPVIHFRRTATEDVVINNTKIAAGDKVVMWYNSANRDAKVWDNAYEFDVRRQSAAAAGRLRCRWTALLPRRQPRPPRDRLCVRRDPSPDAEHAHHRRAGMAREQLHQRHQAPALRLVVTPSGLVAAPVPRPVRHHAFRWWRCVDRTDRARDEPDQTMVVAKKPLMSTIRSVPRLLKKHSSPDADSGTMTALATVWPATKFTLDTPGLTPHGYTVTKPAPTGLVTVTFNETAPTPSGGVTSPSSVICTRSSVVPPICCFATSRSASGLCPARVSNTRAGDAAGA